MGFFQKAKDIIDSNLNKQTEEEIISQSSEEIEETAPVNSSIIQPSSISGQAEPDYVLELDVSNVKNLQIGYQAETMFLYESPNEKLIIKEYINGLNGSEYFAKLTANRFKTTIRHGRREEVNLNTYVLVYLPKSFKGEFAISSQYGSIYTDTDWEVERFAAETMQGEIKLQKITAPRIRLNSPVKQIDVEEAIGFIDVHSVDGPIRVGNICGGANLNTSSSPIHAKFSSLNNIIEANTLNADIDLILPKDTGLEMDGMSKRGEITCELEGVQVRVKPGNAKALSGTIGTKPFYKVKFSTINGNVLLH